jgi:hypothetical protein
MLHTYCTRQAYASPLWILLPHSRLPWPPHCSAISASPTTRSRSRSDTASQVSRHVQKSVPGEARGIAARGLAGWIASFWRAGRGHEDPELGEVQGPGRRGIKVKRVSSPYLLYLLNSRTRDHVTGCPTLTFNCFLPHSEKVTCD